MRRSIRPVHLLLLILALALHLRSSAAIQFYLGDGQERCISEDGGLGDLVVLEYSLKPVGAVASVLLLDPANGRLYYKDASVSSETEVLRFAHTSNRAGEYRLCFTNRDGRGQQTVDVQLKVGANSPEKAAGGEIARKETLKPMESKLQQLETTTSQILTEMKALSIKELAMKAQAESTSSRMVTFSVVSTVLLLALKAAEVVYLRQYFRSRRMIQ